MYIVDGINKRRYERKPCGLLHLRLQPCLGCTDECSCSSSFYKVAFLRVAEADVEDSWEADSEPYLAT